MAGASTELILNPFRKPRIPIGKPMAAQDRQTGVDLCAMLALQVVRNKELCRVGKSYVE